MKKNCRINIIDLTVNGTNSYRQKENIGFTLMLCLDICYADVLISLLCVISVGFPNVLIRSFDFGVFIVGVACKR